MAKEAIRRELQIEGAKEMKYLILGLLSFLAACASQPNNQNASSLQYDKVMQLHIGETTGSDVVKTLGVPSARVERSGYYILNYNTPQTGFQRLSLNVNNANNKLASLLWIPTEGENESSLERAKASFKDAKFKMTEKDNSSPHAISKVVVYTDDTTGVTIQFNPSSNLVEAIAKYDASSPRAPATAEQKEHAPYTFGDEPKSSR